jgi:L-ribulokinase
MLALLAAGTFHSIEEAQERLCPGHRVIKPDPAAAAIYEELYGLYKKLYFAFGAPDSPAVSAGDVLPALRRIAARARVAQ